MACSVCRYYWMEDENLYMRAVNAQFPYGYEYLGNTSRLVITPLTDRYVSNLPRTDILCRNLLHFDMLNGTLFNVVLCFCAVLILFNIMLHCFCLILCCTSNSTLMLGSHVSGTSPHSDIGFHNKVSFA